MFNQIFNNSGILLDAKYTLFSILASGIGGLLLLLIIISVCNFIYRIIQKRKQPPEQNKLLKDIIKNECKEMLHKEINLGVFANEMHYAVNKVVMYLRGGINNEHIIVLHTDKGCLVETFFDSFHANDEFTFICDEEEAAKEGEKTSINLFTYKLFDNNLEKEIVPTNLLVPGHSTAA
jgi:hypothetical protein